MPNIKRANTSGITKSGVAIADVPDAPIIGSATAGIQSATVSYTAATTGGTATTFTATSTPGSITGTGSSPITVTGLTADTSYTFTVRASNSTGNSPFSSASNSITALSPAAFESIATVSVGAGGQSVVSFTSIPSTFKHLQIRALVRTANPGEFSAQKLTFNSDGSSSNYVTLHQIYGFGSGSPASQSSTANGWIYQSYLTGANAAANRFGAMITDILDYTSTNKNKTTRTFAGNDLNGAGAVTFGSGLWMNSSTAINRIDIVDDSNGNISQYSHYALYGIKG